MTSLSLSHTSSSISSTDHSSHHLPSSAAPQISIGGSKPAAADKKQAAAASAAAKPAASAAPETPKKAADDNKKADASEKSSSKSEQQKSAAPASAAASAAAKPAPSTAAGGAAAANYVPTKEQKSFTVHDEREHLNIVFIGHVDAGKSTISGQILYVTLTLCIACPFLSPSLRLFACSVVRRIGSVVHLIFASHKTNPFPLPTHRSSHPPRNRVSRSTSQSRLIPCG
jgi:hypothetical protein